MKRRLAGLMAATDPACRILLLSDVLYTLAQMIGYIAIPWWITEKGGAQDLFEYGIVVAVATIIAQPLLGPIGERYPKRTQMILGVAGLAGIGGSLATVATFSGYQFTWVIVAGLLAVPANAFVLGASKTIVPELAPATHVPQYLALRKRATSVGRLMGPLVGGGILASGSIAATLWVYCVLLAITTVALRRLVVSPTDVTEPVLTVHAGAPRHAVHRWWSDFRAGWRAKWTVPVERGWTIVNFLVWIFVGPAFTLFVPLKIHSLGLSSAWLGACEASISVGMLLGSLGMADRLTRYVGRYRIRVGAAVSEGLILSVVGVAHQPLLIILAFGAAGFANTLMALVGSTHRTLAIPKEFRVRMASVSGTTTQVAGCLGPAIAGAALLHWRLSEVYVGFGLLASLLASSFVLVPRASEFFGLSHHEVVDWYRREYPSGFDGRRAGNGQNT